MQVRLLPEENRDVYEHFLQDVWAGRICGTGVKEVNAPRKIPNTRCKANMLKIPTGYRTDPYTIISR